MFLGTLPRRTTQTYNVMVHEVGVHCGLPGLTPRTLRHTFLRLLADKTRDIDDVMRYGGCSLAVAVGYVRTTDSERDKAILEGL
jgi:integrase